MRLSRRRFFWLVVAACFLGTVGLVRADQREPFCVVALPDTQYYSQKYTKTFEAQTQWIKEQAGKLNIRFVVHEGDVVQRQAVRRQWEVADRAMRVLDGVVPYSIAPGNHDMLINLKDPKTRDTTIYNEFFGPKRFEGRPWYGGNKDGTNDNNYCFFEAARMKFLVMSLEYDPNDSTLAWAGKILDAHPEHQVIIVTHCYLGKEGRRETGDRIWEQLIRSRPGVFLVLCGHVHAAKRLTQRNDAGQPVYEILTDYQNDPHGGDGWLRVLRFVPEKNRIDVKTYSPTLKRYNHSRKEKFSLPYDMSPRTR